MVDFEYARGGIKFPGYWVSMGEETRSCARRLNDAAQRFCVDRSVHAHTRFAQPDLDEPLALSGRLRYSGGNRHDIDRIALRRSRKLDRHEHCIGLSRRCQLATKQLPAPGVQLIGINAMRHGDLGTRRVWGHGRLHNLPLELGAVIPPGAGGLLSVGRPGCQDKSPSNIVGIILVANVY